ncbi:MAG TPA: Ig-like domain-containing protein [Pyrinomonadaceae bacterium]|nr:Ig-like domain-containing protein [Pyrinomonadaceae bacterium]
MKVTTFKITLAVAAIALTCLLSAGTRANAQSGDDTTQPQVTIHSPTSGDTVSGKVTVVFSAFDIGGLMKFELYVDGELQQTILPNSRTQHFTWNCNKASKGEHEIIVKAYDASGNVGTSATCYVFTDK